MNSALFCYKSNSLLYNIYMIRKLIKKAAKKVSEIKPVFNEYGHCIACQGGKTECLHKNLAETNQGTSCVACGFKVK